MFGYLGSTAFVDSQADLERLIDLVHRALVRRAQEPNEALAINGANLIE